MHGAISPLPKLPGFLIKHKNILGFKRDEVANGRKKLLIEEHGHI
jgi:hypothetical protein